MDATKYDERMREWSLVWIRSDFLHLKISKDERLTETKTPTVAELRALAEHMESQHDGSGE